MSTYMYLRCEDHDPPILADDESGQHYYDLHRIREEVANRAAVIRRYEETGLHDREGEYSNYFPRNSARFLRHHPKCRISIITEYGEDVTEGKSDD